MNKNPVNAKCGARTRAGTPCQKRPISGKRRCRNHGGKSTGPLTEKGKAAISASRTTHGRYTAAGKAEKRADRDYAAEIDRIASRNETLMLFALRQMAAETTEEHDALQEEFRQKHPDLFEKYAR